MSSFTSIAENTLPPWQGFRFQIVPTDFTSKSQAALLLAGIHEIQFPTSTVQYTNVPTLGTREYKVPSKKVVGQLTLRGCVVANSGLWNAYDKVQKVLLGDIDYTTTPIDFIIAEYNIGAITNVAPVAMWLVQGAQATSFTPAPANAMADALVMDTVVFEVDSIKKLR